MARPKSSEPMVTVSLRMPTALRDRLAERGPSLSAAIVAACEAALAPPSGDDLRANARRRHALNEGNRPSTSNPASRATKRGAVVVEAQAVGPCPHPITRRLGGVCMECGATVKA